MTATSSYFALLMYLCVSFHERNPKSKIENENKKKKQKEKRGFAKATSNTQRSAISFIP